MAKIEDQYEELVESHTTEEILIYITRRLEEAVQMSALNLETGEVTKDRLMFAQARSNEAYFAIKALAKKLKLLDDTPAIVA